MAVKGAALKGAVAQPPCSDEAVEAATGRTWAEWCQLLDKAGANEMAHPEIARLLSAKHKVPDWWSQQVTVGYERIRGLRAVNETSDGFQTSVQRTFKVAADEVWDAVLAASREWLGLARSPKAGDAVVVGNARGEVRAVRQEELLRFFWQEHGWGRKSRVEVTLQSKATGCAVRVQHDGLPDAESVAAWRKEWKERLAALA